ncbi:MULTISPECIES: helix-turn-helix domain-containing protein [Shewanella]|uniref:Helix-turn-helix domain-containing protein n=1 Tax=Shewanella marisflavi TaxID=260364 RepID=A0ABX5WLW7_9GAMM|nr:helix-turn-helix domain-containing protein [Shewanella marisflavi]
MHNSSSRDSDNSSKDWPEFLTPDEVCKILDISRKTLCEYCNKHQLRRYLTVYRLSHKNVRYCKKSVYEFIERCKSH